MITFTTGLHLSGLSIYLSIHSAAPSFRVLRAVALSVQELKERL